MESVTITVAPTTAEELIALGITESAETITLTVSELGATGLTGPAGVDYDPSTAWFSLASGFASILEVATTLPGTVLQLTYGGGAVRYRYIATDGSIDGIYTGFSDPTLTGLRARKKILL